MSTNGDGTAGPLILAVDDEPGILRLVDLELSEQGFSVVTARSGDEALQACYEQRPDLVILDLMLPDQTGYEVMRQLRERVPVPIIVLTAKGTDVEKVRGLELGADDYLAKPFNPDELGARVRAVLRRARPSGVGAGVVRSKGVEIDLERRLVSRFGERVHLTRTEWQLLEELASHPDKVMSGVELLTHVWGPEYRDDLQYLRVWVSRLRTKLDPERSEPELIQTFPGIGYLLCTEDAAVEMAAAEGS
ncbi:MAG: response regulator transcription factor [Dehalococcoidia bacterium]